MVFLLVFHNDPERPPHAFLLQRVSDRVLVTNLQLFHRSPPPSYSAGRERRLLSRRLTCSCPASACTPACGPPDQSFYGLRLPHRTLSPVVEAKCLFVKLELLKSSTHLNHFALKTKLSVAALHSAFDQLRQLQPIPLTA